MEHREKPNGFDERLAHSVDLLRRGEALALRYSDDGYYLAFSGGKDSQALYHVAVLAGVRFKAYFELTTIDPPEQVRFVKSHYPEVVINRPVMNFGQLCIKKKALPTRLIRFCCAILKEAKGAGTVTLTGVRREESTRRALRQEAEKISKKKNRFGGSLEQLDQFTRHREEEGVKCIGGRDKFVINPILDWTEQDVWYFLDEVVHVEHCVLYDRGWRRIGCLFCPMATKAEIEMHAREYPKYRDSILRTIRRLLDNGYMKGYPNMTPTDVYNWWVSKDSIKRWYVKNK